MVSNSSSLVQTLSYINIDSFHGDGEARREVLEAARAMTRRIETPTETLIEMALVSPYFYVALRVAQQLDIFEKLGRVGDRPKSTTELAGEADTATIGRYLRHLTSMGCLKQIGEDHWAPTRHTEDFRKPELTGFIEATRFFLYANALKSPSWLSKNGYKAPQDPSDCPWSEAAGMSFFESLKENVQEQTYFTNLMRGYRSQSAAWTDVFPTASLVESADKEGPMIVDLGGSSGHDLKKFMDKHPETAGRLIFQDQAHVIEEVRSAAAPGLTPMAHDFFTPQPVQGARAYFMHSVLHDWPDHMCQQILANLKPAFRKGYSTLLTTDIVIPSTGASRYQTCQDLCMSNIVAGKERTERECEEMFASGGFKIVKFHRSAASDESVIEAVPM